MAACGARSRWPDAPVRSPDGAQRNPGPLYPVARFPDYASLHPGYKPLRCPPGKTREPWVNARHQKYSTLPKFGNGVCIAATRPMKEGRIAIVTNAGRAAVDEGPIGAKGFAGRATVSKAVAHTTGGIGVWQNRVVLAPGACAPSLVVMHVIQPDSRISDLLGDGGNSASLPGEITT